MINLLNYLQTQQPTADPGGQWVVTMFPMGNQIEIEIDGICTPLYNGLIIANDDPVVDMAGCNAPFGQYIFEYSNLPVPGCTMPSYQLVVNYTQGMYSVTLSAAPGNGCAYTLLVMDGATFNSSEFTPQPAATEQITLQLSGFSNSCGVADPPNTVFTDPIYIAMVASSELDGPSTPAPIPNVEYIIEMQLHHHPTNAAFTVYLDPTDPVNTIVPAPFTLSDLFVGSPNFENAALATVYHQMQLLGYNWFSPRFQIKKRSSSIVDVYFPIHNTPSVPYVGPFSLYSSQGSRTSVTYKPVGSGTALIMGDAINYGAFNSIHNPNNGGQVNVGFTLNTPCGNLDLDVFLTQAQVISGVQIPAYTDMVTPNLVPIPINPEYSGSLNCTPTIVTATETIPCPTTPTYQWTVDNVVFADTDNQIQVSDLPADVSLTYTCNGCSSSVSIQV